MGATQYVAFLRAVNVGGRVVTMGELKAIFDKLGLSDVSTFIASGNVIFRGVGPTDALRETIERGLQKALGYAVATMLRTVSEVADVARYEPFPSREMKGGSLHVGFMRDRAAAAAVKRALSLQTDVDALHVRGREVYWLARQNIAGATITGAAVETALGTPVTFRNMNTVRRIAAKYAKT